MFQPEPRGFYSLDEQSAKAFDAKQSRETQHFIKMLPGGNAYLLDENEFDPLEHDDIDPGDVERGCVLRLEVGMSVSERQALFSGLIEDGYAISPYLSHVLIVPWRRDVVTEGIARDIRRILSDQQDDTAFDHFLAHTSMEQKIERIANASYRGEVWDLLESLAFCLRMLEIAYANLQKHHQSPRRMKREFLEQITNGIQPACKLAAAGYPEAVQMLFRRCAEMGVPAEQAVNLTLEANRSSLSPFTTERSLLEAQGEA